MALSERVIKLIVGSERIPTIVAALIRPGSVLDLSRYERVYGIEISDDGGLMLLDVDIRRH